MVGKVRSIARNGRELAPLLGPRWLPARHLATTGFAAAGAWVVAVSVVRGQRQDGL